MGTLKLQSNGPLYSDTVIGTLVIDGWAVTFGTTRRGLGGLRPRPVTYSLYQMYQRPVYQLHIIQRDTLSALQRVSKATNEYVYSESMVDTACRS